MYSFRKSGWQITVLAMILITVLACAFMTFSQSNAIQNLDEMMARKARYATASWGYQDLEGGPPYYYWQPESLCYTDTLTGHEVWILMRTPQGGALYSNEASSQAWSYDGSRMTAWAERTVRQSANPALPPSQYNLFGRWIFYTDGSKLRACEGPGISGLAEDPEWANTEMAYYYRGSGHPNDGDPYIIYKCSVDANNVVTSRPWLNGKTASGGSQSKGWADPSLQPVHRAITEDDSAMLLNDLTVGNKGRTLNCEGLMKVAMGASPSITAYWGINRNAQQYSAHSDASEATYHGGGDWRYGAQGQYVQYNFPDTIASGMFQFLTSGGHAGDGGPLTEAWNGSSYGNNEVYPISLNNKTAYPVAPGPIHTYFNHPSLDRWDQYYVGGEGDGSGTSFSTTPGTGIWLMDVSSSGTYPMGATTWDGGPTGRIDAGLSTQLQYDGLHHSWSAFADDVVFFPSYVGNVQNYNFVMYGSHINWTAKTATPYPLAQALPSASSTVTNYNAYPRPSQSPDGTKVAFQQFWLNNYSSGVSEYPYVAYVVAYYPYPGVITAATQDGNNVKLAWTYRPYSTRNYPVGGSSPPVPKEIKFWHVWYSIDKNTWTEATTTGNAFASTTLDFPQPASSTYYYAVTAEENSRLESHRLGNVWKVVTNGSGNISSSAEDTAYPSAPGTVSAFYTTKPPAPTGLSVAVNYRSISGHNRLVWIEPGNSKIRYYNIYYSSSGTPPADQHHRIASIPVGTSTYLDWSVDPSKAAYYQVTSVDRQGNESNTTSPPAAPTGLQVK